VRNRSGVARKPAVPSAEPGRSRPLWRALSACPHKDGTWLTTKQHLRRNSSPIARTLYDGRNTCRLHSWRALRLATARDGECRALRTAILSGIPNDRIALFLQCPVCALDILLSLHSRRATKIPLVREDIPDSNFRCATSAPPPGPDVIFQFRSLGLFT
jgi:hypothetical protein